MEKEDERVGQGRGSQFGRWGLVMVEWVLGEAQWL